MSQCIIIDDRQLQTVRPLASLASRGHNVLSSSRRDDTQAVDSATLAVFDLSIFGANTASLSAAKVLSFVQIIVARFEDTIGALRTRGAEALADKGVLDKLHMLAGSAGMFGFVRLTNVAKRCLASARLSDAAVVPVLSTGLLDALEVSLQAARDNLFANKGTTASTPQAAAASDVTDR